MRYFFILLCLSIFSTPLAFATDTPPDSAVFSSDGTHWYVLNGGDLTLDTGKKVSYVSMETPFYEGNSLYALASDESGKNKYILKDGVVIDQGQSAAFLQNYGTVTNLEGWYSINNGVYKLKDTLGNTLLEVTNAGTSSYSATIAKGVMQSVIYDRNNQNSRLYFNEKKIADNAYSLGVYKNKKKTEIIYTSTDAESITRIFAYDMTSRAIRSLPGYDGVSTYATTFTKTGNIKNLQYAVLIGKKYATLDITGKIVSTARYDEIIQISAYGDGFFMSYKNNGKIYFSFQGKIYGGYDEIDTLNTMYSSTEGNHVENWSIFVKKGGKTSIVANGKEIAL